MACLVAEKEMALEKAGAEFGKQACYRPSMRSSGNQARNWPSVSESSWKRPLRSHSQVST